MKLNKRILSLILVVVMVLGMVPMATATDDAAATCTECGAVGGHGVGCSQYVIPTCEECHGDLIGENAGHSTACSHYVAPVTLDEGTPAPDGTTTGTTVGTTAGTTEGTTEGTTVATTEATTVPTTEATTEPSTEATTVPTTQETTEATSEVILCEFCNATVAENGTIVHEEHCVENCTCEPVDGVHQSGCIFAPVYINGDPCYPSSDRAKNFTDAAAPLISTVRPLTYKAFFRSIQPAQTTLDHEDLHTSKNLVYDSTTGQYKLRLEAFLEGDPTTKERIPSDMILVLDQSTSMSFCMNCGKDIDVRSILEHYKNYWVTPTSGSGDRVKLYYCPGSKYGNTCVLNNHTDGGWFSKDHTSSETKSQGDRFVPSIADTSIKYSSEGGNNIYPRVFYTSKTGTGKINMWVESSSNITSSQTYFRKSGNQFVKLKYCSAHAAWHDDGTTCSKKNYGTLAYYVPTAKPDEVTHGTTRFYRSNSDGTGPLCGHSTANRYQALITALESFTDSIFDYSTTYDLNNRMAVVAFANGQYNRLLSVPNGASSTKVTPIKMTDATSSNYANSLHDVSTSRGQAIINDAIDKVMDQGGGTDTANGMQMANNVFANNARLLEGETKRNRIVILFTDGRPEQSVDGDNYHGADTALQYAYSLRDSGATIYTIGVFPEADASEEYIGCVETTTTTTSSGNLSGKASYNKFMHLMSSNYTGDTVPSMANTYDKTTFKSGYYLSAGDPEGLREAFYKIAENINNGSVVDMNETTVVKDVITPYFQVEDGSQVTFHTEVCTGKDASGKYIFEDDNATAIDELIRKKENADKRVIEVDGFDFSEYYVTIDDVYGTPTPRGRKLVIEIPIEPNPDFLGGDNIPTNTSDSGVYTSGGDPIEYFNVPRMDVEVSQINPLYTSRNIYISQAAALPDIIRLGEYNQNGSDWVVDSINNAYVNIVYTITDPTGTSMTYTIPVGTTYEGLTDMYWSADANTHPLLKEDTTYTVTCKVTSVNNAENTKTGKAYPEVLVYKPEITFVDSSINLGDTANYADNQVIWSENESDAQYGGYGTNVRWLHGTQMAEIEDMGEAPELEFSYDPIAGKFKSDTPVQVTVTSKSNGSNIPVDQEITKYSTFYREDCSICDFHSDDPVDTSDNGYINFIVHLNTFDLCIIKNVDADELAIDPGTSFLFRVTGPENFTMDVVINDKMISEGKNYILIEGLRVGEYEVKELDWSWRYTPDNKTVTVDGKDIDGVCEAEFTNTRTETKWLDGESYAKNVFAGKYTPPAAN